MGLGIELGASCVLSTQLTAELYCETWEKKIRDNPWEICSAPRLVSCQVPGRGSTHIVLILPRSSSCSCDCISEAYGRVVSW